MGRTILVTGGAGFIGSNYVRLHRRHRPDDHLINVDALSYCGNLDNLSDLEGDDHHRFVHGDIRDAALVRKLMADCDAVVHFAAESHVDRSLMDSAPFVSTNVLGTQTLLDAAATTKIDCFIQVSTDEVYGSLPLNASDAFTEDSPLRPSSPYAASKAAGDLLAMAYHASFGLDVRITRGANNFGPYQFPEKVIPLWITNLLQGLKMPIYGDGRQVRDWIHVDDHCLAVLAVLEQGRPGRTYNIGANNELANIDLARMLLDIVGSDASMIEHVTDRPGHDVRYALCTERIRSETDWQPKQSRFPEALTETVAWYREHKTWWQRARSGAYREFYQKQYGTR